MPSRSNNIKRVHSEQSKDKSKGEGKDKSKDFSKYSYEENF